MVSRSPAWCTCKNNYKEVKSSDRHIPRYSKITHILLVVSTPLKNMKVSWDAYSQYMEKWNSCSKPPTRYHMAVIKPYLSHEIPMNPILNPYKNHLAQPEISHPNGARSIPQVGIDLARATQHILGEGSAVWLNFRVVHLNVHLPRSKNIIQHLSKLSNVYIDLI